MNEKIIDDKVLDLVKLYIILIYNTYLHPQMGFSPQFWAMKRR